MTKRVAVLLGVQRAGDGGRPAHTGDSEDHFRAVRTKGKKLFRVPVALNGVPPLREGI